MAIIFSNQYIPQIAVLDMPAGDVLEAAGMRIQQGEYNSAIGAKRGFRVFPNDPVELADSVQFAENLNALEADLEAGITPDRDYSEVIAQYARHAFDDAANAFLRAGQKGLAGKAYLAKESLIQGNGGLAPAP